MYRLIFLLLLVANIVPLFLEGAGKCYIGPNEHGDYGESECGKGVCFSIECSIDEGPTRDKSRMGCGATCKELGYDSGVKLYGCTCNDCTDEDLCNGKKVALKCYEGPSGPGEVYDNCTSSNNEGCYTRECNRVEGPTGSEFRKGCGKCAESDGCKCTNCNDKDFCNDKSIGSIKQCYGFIPDPSGNYGKVDCKFHNNDACLTMECNNLGQTKRCGKCPDERSLKEIGHGSTSCTCTDCTGELCNSGQAKSKGSIQQCYGGRADAFGKYEIEKCEYYNNNACQTMECYIPQTDLPDTGKSCGKCPDEAIMKRVESERGINCTCKECTGELCNSDKPKSKGNTNKCYVGNIGGYKEENCTIDRNDGCYTLDCADRMSKSDGFKNSLTNRLNNPEEEKHCGKCPVVVPDGCKCTDCVGDMCNKEDLVSQCYWGDDQKGYEVMDCKADGFNNKACRKVKCRGAGPNSSKNYRDCGRCPSQSEDCKCFQCNDKDLCNDSMRIGSSSSFMLMFAMIGGVVALLAMKQLGAITGI